MKWAALGGMVPTAIVYAHLLARVRRYPLQHTEVRWWAGYLRDVANLVGFVGYLGVFLLSGYGGPSALVLAVPSLVTTYGLDWLLGRRFAWLPVRVQVAVALAAILSATAWVLDQPRVAPWLLRLLEAAAP